MEFKVFWIGALLSKYSVSRLSLKLDKKILPLAEQFRGENGTSLDVRAEASPSKEERVSTMFW